MKYLKLISIFSILILLTFVCGVSYQNYITPDQVPVKIKVGNECMEMDMSIQDWYFQQKLWVKLNMPEQLTQICN